jgi:hypothetical protein
MTDLATQAIAVELAAQGLEFRISQIHDSGKKWPDHDLEAKRVRVSELRAAATTLNALSRHPDAVREALKAAREASHERPTEAA